MWVPIMIHNRVPMFFISALPWLRPPPPSCAIFENGTETTFTWSFSLQFRALAPMYYRGSAAAIIVYDITKEVKDISCKHSVLTIILSLY